jgi:PAS domain S-box-containing protein
MAEPVVPPSTDVQGAPPADDLAGRAGADLAGFFDLAVDLLCVADTDGRLLRVSGSWETVLGYPLEELVGRRFLDFVHPDDLPATFEAISQLDRGVSVLNFVNRYRRRDGEWVWLEWRSSAPGGGPIYGVARDITDRRRVENERRAAEEALRESERQFRTLVEHANDAISVVVGRRVAYLNQAAVALYGASRAEDLIGQDVADHVAPESKPLVEERIGLVFGRGEAVPPVEVDYIRLDGVRVTVEATAAPIVYEGQPAGVVFARNVSERKRIESVLREGEVHRQHLEAQLAQAQKMEAVGQLAGGVAHDFNNMLSVITGHAEMALLEADIQRPVREGLEQILAAGRKSADLTRQLLAFARRQPVRPRLLDLNETVEGLLKMLRRLIGEGVDLRWQPGQGLWPLKLDPSQVDQVLANLVVNSRDAMGSHGTVTIETSNVTADADFCARHVEFQPGHYVRLAVSDTGAGMSREVLAHVFEPFFTTKVHGRGTGLGLSTVYGIVKQNGGIIAADSEPGTGATFTIWFPRTSVADTELEAEGAAAEMPRGRELVLVVEDAESILAVTRTMLDRLGYTTLGAGSPADAIRVAAQCPERIDLLITDVIMPEMNGRELAVLMAERDPRTRCLFMSGYTADVIARHGVLDESVHFLQKPFSLRTLAEAVRTTLDDRR